MRHLSRIQTARNCFTMGRHLSAPRAAAEKRGHHVCSDGRWAAELRFGTNVVRVARCVKCGERLPADPVHDALGRRRFHELRNDIGPGGSCVPRPPSIVMRRAHAKSCFDRFIEVSNRDAGHGSAFGDHVHRDRAWNGVRSGLTSACSLPRAAASKSGRRRSAPCAAESPVRTFTGREIGDDVEFGLHDRNDDELRQPLHRLQ